MVVGLVFAGLGGYFLYKEQTTPWVSIDARVVESSVFEDRSTGRSGSSVTWGNTLKYSFTFEGKDYTNAFNSPSSSDYGAAQRYTDEHLSGTPIQVKVNPADPYDSHPADALLGGMGLAMMIFLGMGIGFALIGAAVLFLGVAPAAGQNL